MSHSLSEVVLERSIGTYRKTPGFSQLQCMALDDAWRRDRFLGAMAKSPRPLGDN
jgi:hypothetical protein